MSEERLQKFLSRAGVASRRKAEEMIIAGKVKVNGKRAELGMKVKPEDEVRVNGKMVAIHHDTVTFALYKPMNVVSTAKDERGRQTVMDLLPPVPGLHPVGRLDRESEGLLLVSNDGDLTLRVTHPRYGHSKEYRIWCKEGALSETALKTLEEGLTLEDGPAKAIKASYAPGGAKLVLNEGRNRQVRRMLGALGYTVERLLRTRIGKLGLEDLQSGQYRELTPADYAKLGYTPKDE
jgi:23S rRNA pseudouridine2605 synthase